MARVLKRKGEELMARRHEDWLAEARCDVKAEKDNRVDAGHYEWGACQARQGAE